MDGESHINEHLAALLAAVPTPPSGHIPSQVSDAGYEQLWQTQIGPSVEGNFLLRRHEGEIKASLKRVWDARGAFDERQLAKPAG